MTRDRQRMRRKVKSMASESEMRTWQEKDQARHDSCRKLAGRAAEFMRESYIIAGEVDGLIKRCKKERGRQRRKGRQYEADQLTALIAQLSQSFFEERDEKNKHLQKTRSLNNMNRNHLHFPE